MSQTQTHQSNQSQLDERLVTEIKNRDRIKFLGVSDNKAVIAFIGRLPTLKYGKIKSDIPLNSKKKAMEYFKQQTKADIDPTKWVIGHATTHATPNNYKY